MPLSRNSRRRPGSPFVRFTPAALKSFQLRWVSIFDRDAEGMVKNFMYTLGVGVWGVWVMVGVQGRVAFGLRHFCILSFFKKKV